MNNLFSYKQTWIQKVHVFPLSSDAELDPPQCVGAFHNVTMLALILLPAIY